MALFENVTYEHYASDLGRSIVPDETTFNNYKFEETAFVKSLLNDGLLHERETGGLDDACCMLIEEAYTTAQIEAGNAGATTSESIGGYSYSKSSKAADIQTEKNAKSAAERKYKWLTLYCDILTGVR